VSLDATIQMFFEEAADLLREFETELLRLEQDPQAGGAIDAVFRSVHTLKGISATLGFEAIAVFTHGLEDLLARLRKGELTATPTMITALLESGDGLRALVAGARTGTPVDAARLEAMLSTVRAHGGSGAPVPATPPRVPVPPELYVITFVPPADLLSRGLDPVRLLDALEHLGEIVELIPDASRLPPLEALSPETSYLGFTCTLRTAQPRSTIESVFEFVGDTGVVRIATAAVPPTVTGRPGLEDTAGGGRDGQRREVTDRRAADGPSREAWADRTSIRVATGKIDRLVNLVGELVVTQAMIAQLVTRFTPDRLPQLAEAVTQMDRHARDLEERVMAVRMLPLRTIFGRFQRVVRDLAQTAGKDVVLDLQGEDTELDKSVIEQISDPLTHLVRNAVDHGIEVPALRHQAGKPATGRVALRAWQQGGNIYLEISDDGRGLDRERIQAKAAELGLLAPDEVVDDETLFAFIFRPGFSTAEQVSEISGRGVGMDVVARNVENLGGFITVHSERGRGTTFRVKLPLTLAILDGQTVRVGSEHYIIAMASVVESVRPRARQLDTVLGTGESFTLRDRPLPLIRLHRLFRVPSAIEDPTEALVVIVEHDGRRVALLVDELLDQQQVVIKSLEANFQRTEGIAGATILGDGRVTLILDVPGLITLARSERPRSREPHPAGKDGTAVVS
jgi:two-component system, chemotaxis family, sensor kinase CheA